MASIWTMMNRSEFQSGQVRERMKELGMTLGDTPELVPFLEWAIKDQHNMLNFGKYVGIAKTTVPSNVYYKQRFNTFKMDAFIQIEHIEEQFNKLPFVTEYTPIPRLNSLTDLDSGYYISWDDMASPEVIELVNEWAGDDFEMYNYIKL